MVSLPNWGAALGVGKRIYADFSEKNVAFMAAGIAYQALVSLAPLLLLLLLVVSVVGGGLEDRLVAAAEGSLPGPIADVVVQIFAGGTAAAGASLIGVVVLLWGTLKIFRGLDTAFSEIYETDRENSLVDQLIDGVVVLAALVVAVIGTVAASSVFAAFSDAVPFLGYLTPLLLLAGLVVAFLPIYYRFPDADVGWREALPGAVFAAVGWAALQAVFQVYLVFAGTGTEDVFGGVLVVVTWLYFSGFVLLVGAVINAVLGEYSTGASGGVGRATASDVDARRTLTRDELASYVGDLRERVTGYHEEFEPASEPTETVSPGAGVRETQLIGALRRVRPTAPPEEDVEVIERTGGDDDVRELTVTFRWQLDGSADARASGVDRPPGGDDR